ncbi:MAG: maleylacetoacetate isomerase [Oligoflexia bacterium]|nr:maleylacetoacetate isomerase [Oligoflexia bacterium]
MNITLYHYWRSSSSWRVRWALDYKKIKYKAVPVDLLNGESESAAHLLRNPMGYVPALEVDGKFIIESLPIIEWLEETHQSPPLLPKNTLDRAHVRALAELINAGIQPVQNLTVLDKYSDDPEKRSEWGQYFIRRGFVAYEKLVEKSAGLYSFGDEISLADICLVPQVYNAHRLNMALHEFPLIQKINTNALKSPSGQASAPDSFKPN